MQRDFHYYCVFVLARLADYSPEEAKIIAYSSQYVDDSLDSEPIEVDDFRFDTVRTAHIGLEAFGWDVQKKVYIPFHFIPPSPVLKGGFSYVTQPDSGFAQMIVKEAINDKPEIRLYRLGIALHTYADTWSHQGFSGRHNLENDVEEIRVRRKKRYRHLLLKNIFLDALPQIGHTEAYKYPDYSYLSWKYKNHMGEEIQRDNAEEFLKAAKAILGWLAEANGKNVGRNWQNNEAKIKGLFKQRYPRSKEDLELSKRCKNWTLQYDNFFSRPEYHYNPDEWREYALGRKDDMDAFLRTDWAWFHRAALMQRCLVLRHIM
jgi:hypothetical protein